MLAAVASCWTHEGGSGGGKGLAGAKGGVGGGGEGTCIMSRPSALQSDCLLVDDMDVAGHQTLLLCPRAALRCKGAINCEHAGCCNMHQMAMLQVVAIGELAEKHKAPGPVPGHAAVQHR